MPTICQNCGNPKGTSPSVLCRSCGVKVRFPYSEIQTCTKCNKSKSREEFYQIKGRGLRVSARCKECLRADQVRREKEKTPEFRKAFYREKNLRVRFNLTIDEYNKILSAQGGVCAICKKSPDEFGKTLAVDHDHGTRLVRGILCWPCNSLLPSRKELVPRLESALSYLNSPPAILAIGKRYANPMKRRRKK